MKRLFSRAAPAALALLALLAGACSHHRIIPDEKLAQIFHDAFLTNAYVGTQGVGTDSLRLYEPIFERYGYTTDDVHYTIGNFSKRKSARLGDIVERAIAQLEKEGKVYNRRVAVLDTIDRVGLRTFRRTVRADSLLHVGALRDTARLDLTCPVEPGRYDLALSYCVDSLDANTEGLRYALWLETRDGRRTDLATAALRRNRTERLTRTFTADSTHERLRIRLLDFAGTPRRPSVTVTDLRIDYTPPTREAVERLYEQQLDIRIFADEFFGAAYSEDHL